MQYIFSSGVVGEGVANGTLLFVVCLTFWPIAFVVVVVFFFVVFNIVLL